jgi:hypothetical protein
MMNRVWETSSALFSKIGEKFNGAKFQEPAEESEERKATKALDSAKIQVRLLAKEGELSSLRRIAEATEDSDLASFTVSFLVDKLGEHEEEVRSHLEHLAMTYSHACLPALISLFNTGSIEVAQPILLERLHKGEYFYLVKNKKARAILLLDVLGAVDEFADTQFCFENFPKVWHSLAERPQEQMYLLSEILGDLNPEGIRYLPDSNMIPQAVKLQALQLLNVLKPDNFERALWYATRDEDDDVAYAATMISTEYWQSEEGRIPASLETFTMLNLNFLFYLCQQSSTFHWQGPAGIGELYAEWHQDMDELDKLDPVADLHRYTCLKNKADRVREQLIKITENRLNALQPLIDTITNSLRLPHARIRSTEAPGVAAAYLVGTGTVEFSKNVLLDDKPLTEEFMSSMLHELGHMEQDVLIIRMMADEIGLKYGQHGGQIKDLFERYSDVIGYVPDSIFLLEVLRLRRDIPLTEEELQRARRLLESARHNVRSAEGNSKITQRLEHIEESYLALSNGNYDWQILECLRDERSLNPLFESGHVPAILIEEVRNCRQKIDGLIGSLINLDPSSAGLNLKRTLIKKDSITIAKELFHSEIAGPLAPILERFRIVLCHMLQEELKRLDKQVSEIRRAGYHEAEAYTISDRVEVIVKALRKGWYAFTN